MTSLLRVELAHQAGSLALRASFTLHAERTALFGPSGSGKSTMLRLLAGLVRPDHGSITLEGRLLTETAAGIAVATGDRGIGFVTQAPALFPHLSVEANLRFGLAACSPAEQRRRRGEVLAMLELTSLARRLPRHLSGGEQQRVALARALVRQPRLLLLDEPFSALDGARKQRLWATLEPFLKDRRVATLLVSHDAAEVWEGAESVIRMDDGVATRQGTPAAMLAEERLQVLRQLGAY